MQPLTVDVPDVAIQLVLTDIGWHATSLDQSKRLGMRNSVARGYAFLYGEAIAGWSFIAVQLKLLGHPIVAFAYMATKFQCDPIADCAMVDIPTISFNL